MTFAKSSMQLGFVVAALAIPLHAQVSAVLPSSTATPTGTYDASTYQYDDGSAENALGLTAGGEICWMHRFTVIGGNNVITSISTAIGSTTAAPPAGTPLTVYVWQDDGDGIPGTSDGGPIGQGSGLSGTPGTSAFTTYALNSPTTVSGTFFIGAAIAHVPGQFPAPMDQSQSSNGRAWIVGDTATFDPADLNNNGLPPSDMDSLGFPAVFLLRGNTNAFADLGNGLAGAGGTPLLAGTGTLVPGTSMSLELSNAAPSAAASLVVGIDTIFGPLKGGILVPDPLAIFTGLVTDGAGALSLPGTWPLGAASGRTTYFQYWIVDAGGPAGFAASNGLAGTTP